ncbi:Phosphoesterase PA-phosphatase related protein OS=Tsukamurella paurometabola (strain ATCC 8368 / DSM / CCUG 35730 / CIP 100753 / JCM 10117 / KCTC 9821 /NBRC 16120 / NCIMB 702349 / NCTC 13040) OX=521096 GN=Tpau_1055 PE=4 SV=1 [Tsukamurella paurometabola]|uniref:Phosphoesterase PA-phosphatase related protein n=1 Tax=Tsukamurella paurometabola (strain ATCC 8368 / DSM 20162 / CCUG 35730 / CIP 100753 / JCM 10117 / KCTC 9821 / NBRC 16120 / NCIMB 702349 / NCTC 13040) TaxID=521096 RepID=D5UV97_TSUPD|nr:phosphatase PAP2 family protein [Tsukamurella paurometabola]ADG77687.1 phosphoesterase PA-phosphatase related protein [Tsukamurella paurometabola DSM 20162]SUP28307.1 PAP2 superfamily [Tsukamurella paurometabola]
MTDGTVAQEDSSTRVAKVITEVGAPWVSNILGSIAVGVLAGSVAWGVVLALLTAIAPMALIFGAMKVRGGGDHHVSDRSQRPLILLLILAIQVIGVVVEIAAGAPAVVIAFTVVGVVTLVVTGVITAALKWKVSLHVAVATSIVVFLALAGHSWLWLLLLVWVALVGWSRVTLKAHTPMQVLVGFVCGVVSAAAALPIL